MRDSYLLLYPHGFLGAKLVFREPPTPPDVAEKFSALLSGDSIIVPENTKPFNREVNQLAKILLSGSPLAKTFDFRSNAVKAALGAFGTSNIVDWYKAQFSSAEFGDIHQRFLDDCFRFILTGERELEPEFWYKILSDKNDRTDQPGSITRAAFGAGHGVEAETFFKCANVGIQQVICRWTSQEDGFEDMVMSLNIMFGV
jgi:hypothetical protein